MSHPTPNNSRQSPNGRFATTHWSVVLDASRPAGSQYADAMSNLCRTYWYPLYAYLRRQGCDRYEAEEYTQAFFTRLLEKSDLKLADPDRGRFRSFLLASLKHFVANERKREKTLKRGGDRKIFTLDFSDADRRYSLAPIEKMSPEKLFERSWALTVLRNATDKLEAESAAADKGRIFDSLKVYLTAEKDAIPYREAAEELQMTEGAVKVAVHRLRRKYRELLQDEIAQTVEKPDDIKDEIHNLFIALAR